MLVPIAIKTIPDIPNADTASIRFIIFPLLNLRAKPGVIKPINASTNNAEAIVIKESAILLH